MAYIAACTDKGAKRRTNQDACCIQVAETPFGEVLMAIVCDGVGGLSVGELASATVAYRFAQWFNEELPVLIESMDTEAPFGFDIVEMVWGVLLSNLNDVIQAYGVANDTRLGTTFTGILVCDGNYLVGHVGDCRLYQITPRGTRQVSEDQTLLQRKLAAGELTPEQAKNFKQGHVILQSVGTEGMLHPAFYRGTCAPADLFVICCDGAYRKAEEAGVDSFFMGVDHHDEDALGQACRSVLQYDLAHGETDNLTVVCVSADLRGRDLPTVVEPETEGDLPTVVEPETEGDLPTVVEPETEGDLPTVVEGGDF